MGSATGGCGVETFAHTNGDGDFVLFDSLGPPWPIHACYLERNKLEDDKWDKKFEISLPKPKKVWKNPNDIHRAEASAYLSKSELYVIGYVQEFHHSKGKESIRNAAGLEAQILWKALGKYPDQLTIVIGDPDLGPQSFTAFADLGGLRLQRKQTIGAALRALSVIAGNGIKTVFVAEQIFPFPKHF